MSNLILSALVGYLLGSVNGAQFIHRFVGRYKNIDPSHVGTGNSGMQNVWMNIGRMPAFLVLAIDLPKGYLAVFAGKQLFGLEGALLLIPGLFAITGHNWPVFFRFRGGRGGATLLGITLTQGFALALVASLIAFPFVVIRFSGLSPFVILASIVVLRYAEIGISLLLIVLVLMLVILLRRVHAEWGILKEAPDKLSMLINIIIYDRPFANPPSLKELFSRKK